MSTCLLPCGSDTEVSLPLLILVFDYKSYTDMDPASRRLAESISPGVPRTYTALAKRSTVARSTLHHRAKGRPSKEEKNERQQYLTTSEEKALVKFVLQMSDLGQPVRIKYIPSLALSIAQHRASASRPDKPPGKNWARSFEKRHPVLRSKRARALDWNRHPNSIRDKVVDWFPKIEKVLHDPAVLPRNVYNMDETGVMLSMQGSAKVLISRNDSQSCRGARVKRVTVTAIECISADGRYLNPMIIWPASTHRADWTTFPTPGWHYACSDSGYTDSLISFEWLRRVFDPQTRDGADQKPRVLICDGFGTHETLEILEFCFQNNIVLCRIPSHTSHKLQPCDVAVFAPLKAAYRDQVERLERAGVGTIGKMHFTALYGPARQSAFSKKNILAGWRKSGLFPFDPSRVLRDMPEAKNASNAPSRLSEIDVSRPDVHSGETALIAVTPVTPVTAEGLLSLQNLINNDAESLDEKSRRRLQKHLQKFSNAAAMSFAERALQEEQIKFLHKVNNEAKSRRTTKSLVLGKAKVMSYEDLESARAKRAATGLEAVARKEKRGKKKGTGVPAMEEMEIDPLLLHLPEGGAPVARMV